MNKLRLNTPVRLTLGFIFLYILGSMLIFSYWNHHVLGGAIEDIDRQLLGQRDMILHEESEHGLQGVQSLISEEIRRYGETEHFYRIVDGQGNVVLESKQLVLPKLSPNSSIREIEAVSVSNAGNEKVSIRVIDFNLSGRSNATVFLGISMDDRGRLQHDFWQAFTKIDALLVVLGLLLGFGLARRFSRQIGLINQLSVEIVESGDLSQRIPVSGTDEFSVLAENLNSMLARIEKLVKDIREAGDNIAHDLRTPLTRLRTEVDLALMKNSSEATRASLLQILTEVEGMQATFNAILELAQAEAGGTTMQLSTLNITTLLNELLELYEASAEESGLQLENSISAGLYVYGDRQLLLQAVANLLDNAIKYVPSGGKIRVSARPQGTSIEIIVEDSGPGIPEQMRGKIFERFTKLEKSRTKAGAGLGLALVKAFIKLHQGNISVAQSSLGGAAFKIVLPAFMPKNI